MQLAMVIVIAGVHIKDKESMLHFHGSVIVVQLSIIYTLQSKVFLIFLAVCASRHHNSDTFREFKYSHS